MPKNVPAIPGVEGRVAGFSQVVEANGFVFLAGQVGDDPETGTVVAGGIEAETRQVLANVRRLLEAVGLGLGDVVQARGYLVDMGDFAAYNAVWREHFPVDPPTRATIGVASLVPPYRVEIEIVAAR
jgi:2-iminobutanoate/2-iminopropanoate deaminase